MTVAGSLGTRTLSATGEPDRLDERGEEQATFAITAEPMAKPLVAALVVSPTVPRLTMMRPASPSNSAGHLRDARGVVGHRSERVFRTR